MGSTLLGWIVDKYHLYKSIVLLSFVGSVLSVLFFTLLSMKEDPTDNPAAMAASILLVGFWVTPLLPITIEVAVEVAYPVPESSTAAMQQVCDWDSCVCAFLFALWLATDCQRVWFRVSGVWQFDE